MPNNPFVLPKGIASADGDAVAASQTDVVGTLNTGVLATANDVEEALKRLDNTGIGAQPRTFTGSFFASWGTNGNQDTWYGGRQSVTLETERSQGNGRYTFQIPDPTELGLMFDDLESRGLGQVYTLTLTHRAGSTTSVVRNSLTVTRPSVSVGGFVQTTVAQGQSVTYRVERIGGVIQAWERLGIQQAVEPVATFGEVVLQTVGWNNSDLSFLPPSDSVQKGYAFPVIGSNPNDGTLRQGLLDAGVSDRLIYDGDYVVWTADAFTNWTSGDDWFVLGRNDLQRMSREQSNFLAQTSEIDNRVDLGSVNALGGEGRVWISQNPLAEAPYITPSTDPNNPRTGDDYAYIGGRENVDPMQRFQFGQNRFNSYLTVGVSPNFVNAHGAANIFIRVRDLDNTLLQSFNLEDDFTFVDDGTFTNSTYRHYQHNTSFNYTALATIDVVLSQEQRHFRMDATTVDATQNINNLTEDRLSADVQSKLNRALPPAGVSYSDIEDRLMQRGTIQVREPEVNVRFLSSSGSGAYPQGLTGFAQVTAENPRFVINNPAMFLATPKPGNFVLRNITESTEVALADSSSNVEILESLTVDGTTFFVYRVVGLTPGQTYEVDRITLQNVIVERNNISNLQSDVKRIDAQLEHAALHLSDALINVLDNEVTVSEETNPTIVPTEYNLRLGGSQSMSQTIFPEASPNTHSSGSLNSRPMNLNTGDRTGRKLVYFDPGVPYQNQAYLTAFDGTTGRDLIRYTNGTFFAQVRVPAIPGGTVTDTIYPAPSNQVSGESIYFDIPALTFVNGVPVPLADELFFTRNLPSSATTLTIDYRDHENGNLRNQGTTTLAGVGGSTDVRTTFTISDGSEQAVTEIWWDAANRRIRVSVTEQVYQGLPTINDVDVRLSFTETRTVPAVPGTTREVALEFESNQGQVFAIKPSATNTLVLVGSEREVDTGRPYTTLFSSDNSGFLTATGENTVFYDYEDFNAIPTVVTDLINRISLPQHGLFETTYTHATAVELDTQLIVRDSSDNSRNVGDVLSDLLSRVTALED